MSTRRSSFGRGFAMLLRCCAAASIAASVPAAAQSLSCGSSGAGVAGLFGSGSGLIARIAPGLGTGGLLPSAVAEGGADGALPGCAPAEVASVATEDPSTLAGNPVDVVSGVKHDRAIDAYLPAAADSLDDVAELVFSRFYASDSPGSPALGPGWKLGLDARLYASAAGSGAGSPAGTQPVLQIVQGDGRRVIFGRPRSLRDRGLRFPAVIDADGVLESHVPASDAGARWIWHWRNGRRLSFDADGVLRRVASRGGAEIALDYDDRGRLAALRTASGHGIGLRYYGGGERPERDAEAGRYAGRLAALFGSRGDLVRYGYDGDGRLVSVVFADGAGLRYEYADGASRKLTAVILPDGRRSEYRYSPDGRVAYSRAAGEPDSAALRFAYRPPSGDPAGAVSGGTVVRIGDAAIASYRWARLREGAHPKLVSAQGPGCSRCPPTGRRYAYDAHGRLTGIAAQGAGRADSDDAAGAGARVAITRDSAGRPSELRWGPGTTNRIRIRWAADPLYDFPESIERPSVVAGMTASVRFVRDSRGRVVTVEESGYAPRVADSLPVRSMAAGGPQTGEPAAATAIRRVSSAASIARRELATRTLADVASRTSNRVWRDDFGRVVATRSPDAGLVRRGFDERDRLSVELRADGASAHYRYDADGRLLEYREDPPPGETEPARHPRGLNTRLRWSDGWLSGVDHESHRETFRADGAGRVVERRVALRLESGREVGFDARYEYDERGVLVAWSLPAGGRILNVTDPFGQTVSLEWQPAGSGFSLPLVAALERDRHGLRRAVYGNGVVASWRRTRGGDLVELGHRRTRGIGRSTEVLEHGFVFDESGALREWRRGSQSRSHLYDHEGRLLQAVHRSGSDETTWRFAYDANGNRLLSRQGSRAPSVDGESGAARFTRLFPSNRVRRLGPLPERFDDGSFSVDEVPGANASWDPAGRLLSDGARSYRWDAGGRLVEVFESGRSIARYRYDAWGQRVAKLVDGTATHFLYDPQRKLLAELDGDGQVMRQYVYLADKPVAVLERAEAPGPGSGGARAAFRVRYLHLNHLGAPEAATDERARVIWRAEYAPFGRRLDAPQARYSFDLALRLPGQYEDGETGLHYNDRRYYDPDAGRYLSPDPLGLAAGSNPYLYAGNDPLTKIDPSGLLLFAFDGTDNSDPPPRRDDWSNVYKLARSYSDGRVWYMAGVGRDDASSGIRASEIDAIVAGTARARVDYMLRELDAAVAAPASRGKFIDVDVIGFSRGAAMARDFSNRVADRVRGGEFARLGACVRLRFIGLWDTVAQFGANGIYNAAWRLTVPAEAAYAAHAVALNEHRVLFPAESIVGSPLAGVRIERGFVGAHADIGGSYAEGDLSDVALIWMHEQALRAGVRLFALTSEFARVSAPLLHDSNLDRIGDREFRYRNAWGWIFANPLQRAARVEGLQWRDTERFILRYPQPQADVYGQPTIAGIVEMASYSAWLAANYGIAP